MRRFLLWSSVALLMTLTFLVSAVGTLAQDSIPDVENPAKPTSSSIIDGFLAMSNTTLYLVLVGMVLSFLYALIQRQNAADDYKAVAFAVVCLVAGAIYAYIDQDSWDANNWIRRALVIWAAGTAFFLVMRSPLRALSLRTDAKLGRTS